MTGRSSSSEWRRAFPWLPGPKVARSGGINQRAGGFANTGVFIGDINIGQRSYELLGLPPVAPDLPAGFSPSQLLSAEHQVIKFWGRGDELRRLADWRDDPVRANSVLLVHGPGGQGKSRLVSRFAEATQEKSGFHVAVVRPKRHAVNDLEANDIVDGNELLILVDYAERWVVEDLVAVLMDRRFAAYDRRRVVLVARTAGLWWQGLRHLLAKNGFGVDSMALGPIAVSLDDRAQLFAEAADRFAGLLPGANADAALPPDLAIKEYGLVLTVHMAALAAVDATRYRTLAPPTGVVDLSAYLLDREVAHWAGLQQSGAVGISPSMMARTVFTAILVGALPYSAAVAALRAARITDDPETAGRILDGHAVCYPPAAQMSLESLYPDRLAEDFLALQIPGHGLASYEPRPWAMTAVTNLILPTRAATWPSRALETLVEAAQRWPHVVTLVLNPLIKDTPEQIAPLMGSMTLIGISSLPSVDVAALDVVYEALPENHISINLGLAALASRIADYRLAIAANPYEAGTALNSLGYRLFNAGQFTHGVEIATRAAAAYREAAQAGTPGAASQLGMALTNLEAALYSAGQVQKALPVGLEAIEALRNLVAESATIRHRRLLAGALLNHGDVLAKLDNWEGALAAVDESQLLFHANLDEFENLGDTVFLAKALVSIGAILRNLGRPEDAVEATEQAVRLCSLPVAYDAYAYEPLLASALHNLSVQLQDLDDPTKLPHALLVARESAIKWCNIVDASDSPQQYAAKLLHALANLMSLAAEANELDVAIAAGEQLIARSPRLASGDLALTYLARETNVRLNELRRLREGAVANPPAKDSAVPSAVDVA